MRHDIALALLVFVCVPGTWTSSTWYADGKSIRSSQEGRGNYYIVQCTM